MDSGKRGMDPFAMTIINPRKEDWPSQGSNSRPPILKSATILTELWGSAESHKDNFSNNNNNNNNEEGTEEENNNFDTSAIKLGDPGIEPATYCYKVFYATD